MTLPPGPSIGAVQTVRYALGPYAFYRRLARTYGDLFTVPTLLGPLVVAGSPEGVRAIFTAPAEDLARFATDAVTPLVGTNALILTHGEPHRRARKLLMAPFTGARMKAYEAVMLAAAEREADGWRDGAPFRMLDATLRITLDVVMRAVFGVDDVGRLRDAVIGSHATLTPLVMLFPFLRRDFGGRGPWTRFVGARASLDAIIFGEIARRKTTGARGDDVLSAMLDAKDDDGAPMSDVEIRDQLVTLVFAGHETTGIALAWAFYWLAKNAGARDRLDREIAKDGIASPYLAAVVDETLRLHPVIPEVIRKLLAPLDVLGHRIPAGTAIGACTSIVHERPDLYPDPHAFRPERFLERTFSPFEHFPYGGGARRCIGASFASLQMKAALAAIVPRFGVELVRSGPERTVLRNLTVGPRHGVEVRAFRRRRTLSRSTLEKKCADA